MVQIEAPVAALAVICERHHIRRILLFGSVLRPDFHAESDVDMLVEFEPGTRVTLPDLARIQREMSGIFGREVDLGTPASLSPYIRDDVLAAAQVIYERSS